MAVARFGGVAAVVLVVAAVVGVGWSVGVAGASGGAVTATADTQPTAATPLGRRPVPVRVAWIRARRR